MTAQPLVYITEEEYLTRERTSTTRHEYYQGKVYAMTGGTEPHNLIAANTLATLHSQLRPRPYRVYHSDMRVKVIRTALNTYPDVTVVCGQPQFTDATRDTLTNPIVVIEVLSPSTERYDRGMKFQNYRTIETLQDYILIAQDKHYIEHYSRQEIGEWVLREAIGIDTSISIQSIDCKLLLSDIYDKVEFDQDESQSDLGFGR